MNRIRMQPWEVYEFPWGSAVKHVKGKWDKLFIKPDAQEIDVSVLHIELGNQGIYFK